MLEDLEPQFLGPPRLLRNGEIHPYVDTIEQAAGVRFLCPKCFLANGGSVGTHGVICWGPAVSQDFQPTPGRWELNGTGFGDLTLTGAGERSNSVQLTNEGGCKAHFHVTNGKIKGKLYGG